MNAIVVVDENWGIGRNGGLLVHLPGDLKYYKQRTEGKTIVLGRKTLESFPRGKPLPNRENIVLTSNPEFSADGCRVCNSVDEALELICGRNGEDVFVSGGAQIYEEFFDMCDVFYVTKIYESFEADRYFPNLDERDFKVVWESELQEEKGITYRFFKYVRNDNR